MNVFLSEKKYFVKLVFILYLLQEDRISTIIFVESRNKWPKTCFIVCLPQTFMRVFSAFQFIFKVHMLLPKINAESVLGIEIELW